MIRRIHIHNFKSIDALELELGQVNLFIGENGSGKSNILEAIGMAAAAATDKLESPSLKARGIRVTEPNWMVCGFEEQRGKGAFLVCAHGTPGGETEPALLCPLPITHESTPYGEWRLELSAFGNPEFDALIGDLHQEFQRLSDAEAGSLGLPETFRFDQTTTGNWVRRLVLHDRAKKLGLAGFLCYSPREEALRDIDRDSDMEPIGVHGEGLFRLLQVLESEGMLAEIKRHLGLIHWFEDVSIVSGSNPSTRALHLRDLYISGDRAFDQRSANEGFLFILLYASLLVSKYTPRFFAVDNVDTALNPKLCAGVAQMFARLTRQYDRQVILTTHNPGTLDGLDLNDDEQRLFVVSRNTEGMTRVRRILPVKATGSGPPTRLSEAFLRGYLGGLPTNF